MLVTAAHHHILQNGLLLTFIAAIQLEINRLYSHLEDTAQIADKSFMYNSRISMYYVKNSCTQINLGSEEGKVYMFLDVSGRNRHIQSMWGTFSRINKRIIHTFTEHIIYEPEKLNLNLTKHFGSHLPHSQQPLGNWKTEQLYLKKKGRVTEMWLFTQKSAPRSS